MMMKMMDTLQIQRQQPSSTFNLDSTEKKTDSSDFFTKKIPIAMFREKILYYVFKVKNVLFFLVQRLLLKFIYKI